MRVAPALLALAAFAALAPAPADAGQVYKWTDQDGKVQFGDVPPPDAVKAELLPIQSNPTDPALLQSLDVQKELRDKQAAMEGELRANQQKRADEERVAKQADCDAARKRYAGVEHSRKFATTGADGKEQWLSFEDADKMKADLKAAADKACAGQQ